METFFDTPWQDVDLDCIEAFLIHADDEGLTWEAKGTERPRPASVRKAVSAFANTQGGFYIVGATKEDGVWRLDPIDFSSTEPGTWLAQVIRSNVRPVPRFDVKVFERDGRHVAIVNVDTVAEPPCMTINGEVFARVSGESYPVTDPSTLRRLFERGEGRAAQAEAEAVRATDTGGEFGPEGAWLRLRLVFAPTGRREDVGGRLFTKSYVDRLEWGAERLPSAPLFPYRVSNEFACVTTQDSVILYERRAEKRLRWTVRARWDGSVAAYLDVEPDPEDAAQLVDGAIFAEAVRPAADVLSRLVADLGGYGRAHVALLVGAQAFRILHVNGNSGLLPRSTLIRAWTDADGGLASSTLDRMRRELCRAAGVVVWEPDEEDTSL